MKGVFALVVTVGISALVWVAVQDWYEQRRKVVIAAVASGSPAAAGPVPGV